MFVRALAVLALLSLSTISRAAADVAPRWAPGHLLVAISNTAPFHTRIPHATLGLPAGATLTDTAYSRNRASTSAAGTDKTPTPRWMRLVLANSGALLRVADQMEKLSWVEFCEPDYIGSGGALPSDPSFVSGELWHLSNSLPAQPRADVHAPEAWMHSTGSASTVVAVLDTGIATGLVDFAGRLLPGRNVLIGAPDVNDVNDDNGHGTAVASLLAASANNGTGIVGVDWACRILPVKVLNSNLVGTVSEWSDGIHWAVDHGADIINISAGVTALSSMLTEAVLYAATQGVVIVSISHNDGTNLVRYPARYDDVIAVGATDRNDKRPPFSNYGSQVDLVAPGSNITVLTRSGGTGSVHGTSFAAPLVAGAAALLRARLGDLNVDQVRDLLTAGADDRIGDANDVPGHDPYYGYGRLNIGTALALADTRITNVVTHTNGYAVTWPASDNAALKAPYLIQVAADAAGPWFEFRLMTNSPGVSFNENAIVWIDDGSLTGSQPETRSYRLRIAPLPKP